MLVVVLFGILCMAWASPVHHDPMFNEGLFEGDILGIDSNEDRNAVPLDSQKWPGGVIPYIVSPELNSARGVIQKAMAYIEGLSCIRFVERSNQYDYIKIFKGSGCYSHWGKIGRENHLSLGERCDSFPIVVHELLHAIGFQHEHSRSDRDDYITINWENIEERWFYAFTRLKPEQNRLLTPFDYDSIMLYSSNAFAKVWNQYTILRKDGSVIPEMPDRSSMSASDAKRINILYNCYPQQKQY